MEHGDMYSRRRGQCNIYAKLQPEENRLQTVTDMAEAGGPSTLYEYMVYGRSSHWINRRNW